MLNMYAEIAQIVQCTSALGLELLRPGDVNLDTMPSSDFHF